MANGTLGKCVTVANENVTVYTTSDASKISFATLNIACLNVGDTEAKVRIAVTKELQPLPQDWIEYDAVLPRKSSLHERTCVVCGPGEKIVVWASTDKVIVRVHGLEQAIC